MMQTKQKEIKKFRDLEVVAELTKTVVKKKH